MVPRAARALPLAQSFCLELSLRARGRYGHQGLHTSGGSTSDTAVGSCAAFDHGHVNLTLGARLNHVFFGKNSRGVGALTLMVSLFVRAGHGNSIRSRMIGFLGKTTTNPRQPTARSG